MRALAIILISLLVGCASKSELSRRHEFEKQQAIIARNDLIYLLRDRDTKILDLQLVGAQMIERFGKDRAKLTTLYLWWELTDWKDTAKAKDAMWLVGQPARVRDVAWLVVWFGLVKEGWGDLEDRL